MIHPWKQTNLIGKPHWYQNPKCPMAQVITYSSYRAKLRLLYFLKNRGQEKRHRNVKSNWKWARIYFKVYSVAGMAAVALLQTVRDLLYSKEELFSAICVMEYEKYFTDNSPSFLKKLKYEEGIPVGSIWSGSITGFGYFCGNLVH